MLYFLIRTLGIDARVDGNFDDIDKDAYYYKEIGIARKLGITKGTWSNKFSPDASITRQDMMVLTERALRMLKKLEVQGAASDLDKFADKSLYVEALEETQVCMIRKNDFEKLLIEYPGIGLKLIEELSGRLERLEDAVKNMGMKTVESRVNAILLEFAQKYGEEHKNGILVELPLSREGIANYIGLARETVSRKLSLLQDEGIIEMIGNKKIVIRNRDALDESTY